MSDLIPSGWKLDRLESGVLFKELGTTSRGAGKENVILIKMGNLGNGSINYKKIEFVEYTDEIKELTLEYGDFLFNTRNTPELVGKVSSFRDKDVKAVFDNNLLRLKFTEGVDSIYMGYLFNVDGTVVQLKRIVAGTTSVAAIYWKDLSCLKLMFPPLPEQQKIAAVLTSVDEVIEKTQASIDKLKDLKTGMMQELLTQGVGENGKPHTEFKDSPVGRIPVGWGVAELVEYLSFISYGFTNPMPESDKGPFMITAKDVNELKVQYGTSRKTTQKAYDELLTNKSKPKINDILLTKDGSLGRVAIVNRDNICINQSVAVLRPNEKVIPKFLLYLLAAPPYQREMLDKAGGSTIKHIYITIVDKMKVAVPSLEEQEKIVRVLDALFAKKSLAENKLNSHLNIKKALMQDLLTGKVRVKVDS